MTLRLFLIPFVAGVLFSILAVMLPKFSEATFIQKVLVFVVFMVGSFFGFLIRAGD